MRKRATVVLGGRMSDGCVTRAVVLGPGLCVSRRRGVCVHGGQQRPIQVEKRAGVSCFGGVRCLFLRRVALHQRGLVATAIAPIVVVIVAAAAMLVEVGGSAVAAARQNATLWADEAITAHLFGPPGRLSRCGPAAE